jgi:hypothetical protein
MQSVLRYNNITRQFFDSRTLTGPKQFVGIKALLCFTVINQVFHMPKNTEKYE